MTDNSGKVPILPTEEIAEEIITQIREQAEEVRQEELDQALTQFAAAGNDVTNEQREILEQLSQQIVDQLLEVPAETLRRAARSNDPEAMKAVVEIFGRDAEPSVEQISVSDLDEEDEQVVRSEYK